MQTKSRAAMYLIGLTAITGAAIGFTEPEHDQDEVVKLSELPKAVRKSIESHTEGGKIERIERSTEDGKTVYEIEVDGKNGEFEFLVDPEGKYLGRDTEDADNEQGEEQDNSDEDDEEQVTVIDFDQAPSAVRSAFGKRTSQAKATRVEKIVDEEVTKYEIEYDLHGSTASVTLSDRGDMLESETPVKIGDLPYRIVKEIMKDYPGASIESAEAVELFYYEMDIKVNGKTIEIAALATGDIEDRLLGDEGHDGEYGQENENDEGMEHADHGRRDHDRMDDDEEEDDD